MMIKKTLVALLVLATFCPAVALSDTEKLLVTAAKETDGALAVLSFKLKTEVGNQEVTGQAFCIDTSGLFLSLAFSPTIRGEDISELGLTTLGLGGKTIKAKLVGIDPETGMGFVQATEAVQWKALKFAEKSNLYIGQPVTSAGLLPAETGHTRYLGAAYVSSLIRIPERQVYVTGGKLTAVGSPVLTADGRVVGIVHRQLSLTRDFITTNRGNVAVRTSGQPETSFFLPVEEFQHVIANAGKERRLCWIGVVRFKPVGPEVAGVMKLDRPGVMIDTVVPGTPAAEAKLQSRDVIVGMNGQAIEELGTPSLTAENMERSIARIPVGKELQLSVFRDGKIFSAAIKTVGLPAMPYEVERYYSSFLGFGVRLRVMLDDYLEGGPTAKVPGLIVYMVLANTPAQVAQVNGNDVVLSIAGTPVNNIDSFKRIEQRILADKSLKEVDMEIARGDRKETLKLPLPKR